MTVSAATLRRLELASGDLAAACLVAMDEHQPWFRRLAADQRAGVLLVTQTGVANFVAWLGERGETIRLTAEAFRIAPRDLARRLSLRQTVDLVRIATDVFERHLPPLAADESERHALVEGILRFGREIAFAAATVYAGAAETRGAWDARQEALVVDAVVRGPGLDGGSDDALVSRASALGWDPAAAVRVVVGSGAAASPEEPGALRREAARSGRSVLVGVQGNRLIVLVSEPREGAGPIGGLVHGFGPGPVVVGPVAPNLATAHASAREALAGLRAAPGWPDAPRPVDADDLLPERALSGDPAAHRRLVESCVAPLDAAGGELLRTLAGYLEGGGALEACARALFVHPNTVRYRLRRVSDLTGRNPTDPRDALVLRTALVVDRLDVGPSHKE
ncbi:MULTISPECIES: helix-turn-helix domain-containing protein [unclassified Pseudonocardia]|uniref:PucR family transcriptional regulator n=1 Tax=unclassified Pseudonocardia TaxID=2619320 RepID=UPI00095EE1A9|nr:MULTISPECIES: helix-turn-helix domain-containing protein [unclassified Pseudonocardia]OJY48676.1 MAG: PucR family transcriptional regulator [Pseudonocardia sp. 73-21]